MTTAFYHDMIQYASRVLPFYSHLEPADLVGDAYVSVGASDVIVLKKKIKSLAYNELNYAMTHTRFTSFMEIKTKQYALIETTRRCKKCGQDKGFHCFPRTGATLAFYQHTCKTCVAVRTRVRYQNDPELYERIKKRANDRYLKIKSDPVQHALLLEKYKRYKKRNKEKIAARNKRYKEKLDADPVRREAYLLKKRGGPVKQAKSIDFSNDPIWETIKDNPEKRRKYLKKKQAERTWKRLREDPVRHAAYLERRRKEGGNPRSSEKINPVESRKKYRESVIADPIKCADFRAKNAAYKKNYMERIKADPELYRAYLDKQNGYQKKWLDKKNTSPKSPEPTSDAYQDYVDQRRKQLLPTGENSWQSLREKIKNLNTKHL